MTSRPVVGVDFDNTIADFDDVIHAVALESQFIGSRVPKSKRRIRDWIRQRQDGEDRWRAVQAAVYGPRIEGARLAPGVDRFLRQCRERGVTVYVISHKTEFATADRTGTNLRDAARGWLERSGLFDAHGGGLAPGQVFFESTRDDKLRRIARMGCTHFIDDLEETFLEPAFPAGVEKILYDPHIECDTRAAARVFTNWAAIGEYAFNGGR